NKKNNGRHPAAAQAADDTNESPAAGEGMDAAPAEGFDHEAAAAADETSTAVEDLPEPPSKREQFELELEAIEKQLLEIGDPFEKANALKAELAAARQERARAIEAHDAKVARLNQEHRQEHWEIGVPNEGRKQKLENRRHELTNLIKTLDDEVTLS
ncbi:MAG TPA: hypothetical protein PLW65_20050, partial [Pseudomonadota bacterium]|nr:hypothetical protein [Pseudomonadota bacterium]